MVSRKDLERYKQIITSRKVTMADHDFINELSQRVKKEYKKAFKEKALCFCKHHLAIDSMERLIKYYEAINTQ